MTDRRVPQDSSLDLPEVPRLRELGAVDIPLRASLQGDGRPFDLRGDDLLATGTAAGLDLIRTPSVPLLVRLRVDGASVESAVETPVGVERRLRIADEVLTERVVVPRSGPVCFLEWQGGVGGSRLVLGWEIPAAIGLVPRWRWADRRLVMARGDGLAIFAFSEEPAEVDVVAGEGDDAPRVRVVFPWPGAAVLRMAVGSVEGGSDRVARLMGRGHAAVGARLADARRREAEQLVVEASDARFGPAVGWAGARLASSWAAARGPAGGADEAALRRAEASLVMGDDGPARRLLDHPPGPGVTADASGATAWLRLVARYLAWTGDRPRVRGVWEEVARVALGLLDTGSAAPPSDAAWAAGLAIAAEEVGDADLAARLAPVVVGAPAGGPTVAAPFGGQSVARDPVDADAAASLVLALAEAVLGAGPDAPRGRLVLRPRVPWDALRVRNLRVGGAIVALEYRRDGTAHRYLLRQQRGNPPLQVVFEPVMGSAGVAGARVDGAPAELSPRREDAEWIVPVQLVLDQERTVEVEMRPAAR